MESSAEGRYLSNSIRMIFILFLIDSSTCFHHKLLHQEFSHQINHFETFETCSSGIHWHDYATMEIRYDNWKDFKVSTDACKTVNMGEDNLIKHKEKRCIWFEIEFL